MYELHKLIKLREAKLDTKEVKLPDDFTASVPTNQLVWLWKYGITGAEIHENTIGYSSYYDRLVIPVYENHNLTCVQMRSISRKPKYLNLGGSNSIFVRLRSDTDEVVVTEDIVSAIKVSRFVSTACTLGTNLNYIKASKIISLDKKVSIWYDNDTAGIKGAVNGLKNLQLQGANVRVIRTQNDPKCYNNSEIKRILDNGKYD